MVRQLEDGESAYSSAILFHGQSYRLSIDVISPEEYENKEQMAIDETVLAFHVNGPIEPSNVFVQFPQIDQL